MVAFDPNAFIEDLMRLRSSSKPMPLQNNPYRKNLAPRDRENARVGNLSNKLDIVDRYTSKAFTPTDRYLDLAEDLMFRANQVAAKAAETRAFRPVNISGVPDSPRIAVQQVRTKKTAQQPVAKGNFGSFVNAIAGKESGGSYQAINKDSGAMGKYQIMPSNIEGPGGWDMEILGRNITPQQFMSNPALQDKIALGKLRQYYNKYGARGAASAWYSGDPNKWQNTSSQGGYPSIAAYVADIIRRMGLG